MMQAETLSETQVANPRIQSFRQRFGEGHFYLACHAALPLALTPDLLYRLWATFQRDCQDHDLAMPWIAVSDLLLSGLCAEVGHELYEMERAVRDELLHQLKNSPRLGLARVREVAEFVIAYSAPQLESADLDTRDFAQAQQWRALAYKKPQEAARTIATTLAGLDFADTHEWLRLEALVATLEEPLAEFPVLLGYVGAIGDLARGNEQAAMTKLNQILDTNNQIRVADVNLPIPTAIQQASPKSQPVSSERQTSLIDSIRQYSYWIIGGGVLVAVIVGRVVPYQQSIRQAPAAGIAEYRTFAEVPNVPQGVFNYGGSTTFAPLRSPEVVGVIKQAHPQFQMRYAEPIAVKPGSGTGIEMLIDRQLSFAQSSRALKDLEYTAAKSRGFALEEVPVAIDGIAVYVHPQAAISSLTVAQLKDIFTGKVTNWKEVGGADLPIVPVSRDPKDVTPQYFEEKVMAKEAFAASVQPYARDTTEAFRKVASTLGGIGYASASAVCNQLILKTVPIARDAGQGPVAPCNGQQVNKVDFAKDAYPITWRLFVIIRRDGKLDEQAGIAYANLLLSDEGQQLVEQVGFVPLRIR